MKQEQIKQRYDGIQEVFKHKNIGTSGCYLLCLCSIAEEITQQPADLIGAMRLDALREDCFVNNACNILTYLTGKTVTMRIEKQVPVVVKPEEYTVLKYYNKRTGYNHFKRRYVDTLVNSVTVKEGTLEACYVFTVK